MIGTVTQRVQHTRATLNFKHGKAKSWFTASASISSKIQISSGMNIFHTQTTTNPVKLCFPLNFFPPFEIVGLPLKIVDPKRVPMPAYGIQTCLTSTDSQRTINQPFDYIKLRHVITQLENTDIDNQSLHKVSSHGIPQLENTENQSIIIIT